MGFFHASWRNNFVYYSVWVCDNANMHNTRAMHLMQSTACLKGDFRESSFYSLSSLIECGF